MGTFFVGLILLAIITLSIFSLLHDKKQGKRSCGGSCGSCAGCARCHGEGGQ
ncbi:MAG: FeoB-associated Cys-rich membrane protein [Oscillospiraceae bacterium]|nr:FeoB-associated Cys-rich membrane protein [Oscillospiraceae bacterium]